MVTFVCSHCDSTLKKKQVQNHALGRCRPPSFICIDCHVTFTGNDFKAHTSCLSQFDKHWGEYAKTKSKGHANTQQKSSNQQKKQALSQIEQSKKQDLALKSNKQIQQSQKQKQKQQNSTWKGWKNEIKGLIKSEEGKIILEDLQERVLKRYRQSFQAQDYDEEELRQVFNDKVRKLKKVKLVTYVSLQ